MLFEVFVFLLFFVTGQLFFLTSGCSDELVATFGVSF
jgi:hypothetical protein